MRYSSFSGLSIKPSCLGLGCWQLGGHGWGKMSETEVIRAVDKAIDSGVNLFDTAPIYGLGHSEEVLGRVLGAKRRDVVIATKVGLTWKKNETFEKFTDCSPANISREVEMSLKRLKTDYIDIYQIHWPDFHTPIEDTMVSLEYLRRQGKIRLIGCCNFSLPLLKEALKYGQIKTVQVPYNLIDGEVADEMLPFCRESGIATLVYGSVGKGLLTGKFDGSVVFGPDDHRGRHKYFQEEELAQNLAVVERLKLVAKRLNRTPAQIALRWVLENPCVTTALVGVRNAAQLAENVVASDFTLPEEETQFLSNGGPRDGGNEWYNPN